MLAGPWLALVCCVLALASLAVPVCALWVPAKRLNEPLDRHFMALSAAWLLSLVLVWWSVTYGGARMQFEWPLLAYHLVTITACQFLLASAGASRSGWAYWVAVYAVVGTVFLLLSSYFSIADALGYGVLRWAWLVLTVFTASMTLLALLVQLWHCRDISTALVVVAVWWGWSLVLNDLGAYALSLVQGQEPVGFEFGVVHIFCNAYLIALWLLLTGRVQWARLAGEPADHPAHSITSLSGFDVSGASGAALGDLHDSMTAVVADERRRIAQDIHDGVGSQLVGLIASLDTSLPLNRRIVLGLERCLLDLKITVDNVEGSDDSDTNIFDALGRMRYRFQPSLTRAGMRMVWKVDVAGPLMAVRPSQLVHLVRIVQESLANVLLHSEANIVRLVCRYEDQPNPHMLLEVFDNGKGMGQRVPDEWVGKGLSGMKERAQRIGAQLVIGTKAGVGTRVRLILPLAAG